MNNPAFYLGDPTTFKKKSKTTLACLQSSMPAEAQKCWGSWAVQFSWSTNKHQRSLPFLITAKAVKTFPLSDELANSATCPTFNQQPQEAPSHKGRIQGDQSPILSYHEPIITYTLSKA